MTAFAVIGVLLAFAIEPGETSQWLFVICFTVWAISLIVGMIAIIMFAVLNNRLSGAARWMGWIAPVGSGVGLICLSVFGLIVG